MPTPYCPTCNREMHQTAASPGGMKRYQCTNFISCNNRKWYGQDGSVLSPQPK